MYGFGSLLREETESNMSESRPLCSMVLPNVHFDWYRCLWKCSVKVAQEFLDALSSDEVVAMYCMALCKQGESIDKFHCFSCNHV